MLDSWQEGQPLDLEQAMMDVTMGIIGRTMVSEDILEEHPHLYHAFNTISTYIVQRATRLSNRLVPPSLPTPANRAFREALATVRRVLGRVVVQRQAQPAEERPHDLLTMMMDAGDDENGYALSDEQLVDELFGIVSAGHETSSITLAWLFHSLAENAEAERKLHEEIDRVLQGRRPTLEDLPNLPYVEQVVNETMRRYPAAYITTRQSIDADEILGYTIPAKAMIIINIYGLHHHPAYWEEPQQFKPERFDPKNADGISKYLYLPFGEGPRKCIGEPLARLEMRLITAMVAQRFCLRQDPSRPAELIARFTLGARDGIWMIPEQR
jgi:cytochrome P450